MYDVVVCFRGFLDEIVGIGLDYVKLWGYGRPFEVFATVVDYVGADLDYILPARLVFPMDKSRYSGCSSSQMQPLSALKPVLQHPVEPGHDNPAITTVQIGRINPSAHSFLLW